jgi:hypothetical protein
MSSAFHLTGIALLLLCFGRESVGFESTIDWREHLQREFVEFQPTPSSQPLAPIAIQMVWNGEKIPLRSLENRRSYFLEKHWAKVPFETTILRTNPVWTYPRGLQLVHEIRFAKAPTELFELRQIEKTFEGWVFSTFVPKENDSSAVQLRTNLEPHEVRGTVLLASGAFASYSIERIRATHCAECHAHVSGSAGPCSFKEGSFDQEAFVQNYGARFGRSPFAQENFNGASLY